MELSFQRLDFEHKTKQKQSGWGNKWQVNPDFCSPFVLFENSIYPLTKFALLLPFYQAEFLYKCIPSVLTYTCKTLHTFINVMIAHGLFQVQSLVFLFILALILFVFLSTQITIYSE